MIATKSDLTKAIGDKCNHCAKARGITPTECACDYCPLFAYRPEVLAKQTNIFRVSDVDVFMNRVLEVALSYGQQPFYWSELRSDVNLRPLHDNWWGVSTRVLKKHSFVVVEGMKRSTHSSRAGGFDRRWKKIEQ